MAIEIIDALKPKNNKNFPVVESMDVFLANGQTLQDYIDNFEIPDGSYEELYNELNNLIATNTATNLYYDKASNQLHLVNSLDRQLGDTVQLIGSGVDGLSVKTEADINKNIYLVILQNDVELCRTLLPATGGGSSSVLMKLVNTMGTSLLTCSYGNPLNLTFNFTSLIGDAETGDGLLEVYVNDSLKISKSILQGDNYVNVGSYLLSDMNTVKIAVTDAYGTKKELSYSVNAVELSITSTFDNSYPYTDNILFKYTPFGNIEKAIHIYVDGELYTTVTTSSYGRQMTTTITGLSHGEHVISAYCTAMIDDVEIISNIISYNVLFYDSNNTSTVLTVYSDTTEVTQGDLITFNYLVYDPLYNPTDVKIYVNETLQLSASVNRSLQTWSTRNYPVGDVEFIFEARNVSTKITVHVQELELDTSIVTEHLDLYLSSSGRNNSEVNMNSWVYGDYTTTFTDFNWVNNGWIPDNDGDVALVLNSDARATINYKPFAVDCKDVGKTIELEFMINNINQRDATVVSCYYNGVGFTITPDTATFSSETSSVSCKFNDKSKIHLAFSVENRAESRLLSVYLNGILSNVVQYPSNDNFKQSTPMSITLGSNDCEIYFYTLRVYDSSLGSHDIVKNYIADIKDVTEKVNAYNRNNIYNSSYLIRYDALVKQIPCMTIIGDLPMSKGDKKKVSIDYVDSEHPHLSFSKSCTIDVQGTSSQYYVRKNYKLKFSEEIPFRDDQLPAKVYTMKADYAESTGTHNTQNANYVHSLYTTPTPPQKTDSKIRTTIYGFPIVIFHQSSPSADKTFIGKYNFNYDKGAENVFGFSDVYPNCQSWEFLNNTDLRCLFLDDASENLGDAFEARYPDGCEDYTSIQRVLSWVVSTRGNVAKFKEEFDQYFNLEYMLIYYVYTFVMLMVDQRAKNMFLTTWDGEIFEPWFYDNDTCLGINNEGLLVFDYYHEDSDVIGTANVYNGQNSTLWVNFKEAFSDEIKETYQALRNNKKLSADILLEYFNTNGASKWSENIYNEDQNFKYIDLVRNDNDSTYLYMARGSASNHREYFIRNRINYCDSKWYASAYAANYATLRIYTPRSYGSVAPNADITITPYSSMYVGVRYKANGALLQERAFESTPVTIAAPNEIFNDTETSIYGASEISSLGDLSPLYCGTINVASCSKLKELIIGNQSQDYSNSNLTTLSLGNNGLLELIDISNCPNLNNTINATGCTGLKHFYAKGTSISAINLCEAGYIETLHLPSTVKSLVIKNQSNLHNFSMDDYANISTLILENVTSTVPVNDILRSCYQSLTRLRLINVALQFEDSTIMEYLMNVDGVDENENNCDHSIITGTCHFNKVGNKLLSLLHDYYPSLTFTYDELEVQYTVTFMDWDNTVLKVENVLKNGNATPPKNPSRSPSGLMEYTFTGWEGNYTNVIKDETVIASYSSSVRKLTVRFLNYDNSVLSSMTISYGGNAIAPSDTPIRPSNDESYVYRFNGWDRSYYGITEDTDIHATYVKVNQYKVIFYNGTEIVKTELVLEGNDATPPTTNPVKLTSIDGTKKVVYTFNSWENKHTNILANTSIYATYDETYYYQQIVNVYDGSGGTGLLLQTSRWTDEDLNEPEFVAPSGSVYVYGDAEQNNYFAFPIWNNAKEFSTLDMYRYTKTVVDSGAYGTAMYYRTSDGILVIKKGTVDKCIALGYIGYVESAKYSTVNTLILSELEGIYNISLTSGTSIGAYVPLSSLKKVFIGDMEINFRPLTDNDRSSLGISSESEYLSAFKNCKSITNFKASRRMDQIPPAFLQDFTASTSTLLITKSVKSIQAAFWESCINIEYEDGADPKIVPSSFERYRVSAPLIIPKNVTSIPSNFAKDSDITEVIIPDGVTDIDNLAFKGCANLTKVQLPKSLVTLGTEAFANNTLLESIHIGNKVESIGTNCFRKCYALKEVIFEQGSPIKKFVNASVFQECTSLTRIILPQGLTSTGNYILANCSSLVEIELPETLQYIGTGCFKDCTSLSKVNIPPFILELGQESFRGCTSLAMDFDMPDGFKLFCNMCFAYSGVTGVTIPKTMTAITDYYAFSRMANCKEIYIPDNIKSLRGRDFEASTGLVSVRLSPYITGLGNTVFCECTSLEHIDFGENPQITAMADRVFKETKLAGEFDLRILSKWNSVWNGTFDETKYLTCVRFPSSFKGMTSGMGGAQFSGSACTHVTFGDENNPSTVSSKNTQYTFENFFLDCSDDMVVDFYLPDGVELPSGSPWGNPNITINIIRVNS